MRLTKKICAIVLTIAMLLSCMCVFTVSAATTNITLDSVNTAGSAGAAGFAYQSSGRLFFSLFTKEMLPGTAWAIEWSHTILADGAEATATVKKEGDYGFFVDMDAALVPNDGNEHTLVFKAGAYTANTGDVVNLTADYKLTFDGSVWEEAYILTDPYIMSHMDVRSALGESATAFQAMAPSDAAAALNIDGSWNDRFFPADNLSGAYFTDDGVTSEIAIGGTQGMACHDSGAPTFYMEGFTATAGDTLTLKGDWYSTYNGGNEFRLAAPVTFTYNGTNWSRTSEIADTTVYQSMTFSGVNGATNYNSTYSGWQIYLTAITDATQSWDYAYSSLTLDINIGGTVTTLNTGNDIKYVDGGCLYIGISSAYLPQTPATGTIVTVSGKSKCSNASMNGVEITEAYSIEWNGSAWVAYINYTTYTGTLTTVGAEVTTIAGSLYMIGSDSLSGAYCDTSWTDRMVPMDGDSNGVFVDGVKVAVDGNLGKILKYSAANGWYTDIAGATTGTVVTVKGTFYHEARATKVVIEESQFQWNGSNWVDYTPVDTTVYDAMTLTGVNSVAATSPWAWYLTTAETDHIGSWDYSFNDLTVTINGTPIDRKAFGFKYTDTNLYSVYFQLNDAATLSATPAVGTTITISGKSKCYNNFLGEAVVGSMNGIELTETFTMVYDGTTWAVPVEYTDVTITGIASNTALSGETWFVYLPTTPSLTHPQWDDGGAYPQIVTIGGTQHTVTVKNAGNDGLFMELPTSILPAVGESITVKAGQYKSTKNYGYNLTADYVMTYIGNGFMPGVYTTVTVAPSTFHSASNFNVAENAWDMYMISPTGLLGKDWDSAYTQNITVNGAATTITIQHGGGGTDTGLMFTRIPASVLSTSGEYTVVLKAGWYADHSKGYAYRIVSDIPLYVNKYGISFTDFITPSTTVKPSLSVSPDGGTATGFHLTASENDGAVHKDDWSLATRANGLSDDAATVYIGQNGFFLNGTQYVQGGTNISGLMKKLGETEYFAALSDIGASVSDGTVLTIKGLFHDQNGYLVEFEESTFSFNGTTWVDCLGDFSGSTMKYDVNNDGKITVKDAVVLEKYLADTYVASLSSTAADIDNSGAIDADDQRLLRRKILGISYEYVADVPVGTPYYGTSEMVKCAYDAPKLGTVDTAAGVVNFLSDDEIDRLMDDYAAVGFTHIQTEFVAELYYSEFGEDYYVNDLLYRYYEEANERGLKVFVYSSDISSWLMSETDVDEYAPNWKAVVDLLVEQQSKHSAFAGFYMCDEPHTAGRYNNYLKVTAYLKEKHPSVGMWWCNNPNAAESIIQTNIGLTYSEYVTGLGTAAGQFMYDNYVLRMKDSSFGSVFDDYYLEPVWFSNLYTVAEAAKAGGFTTGITMQAVALDPDSSTWNKWMNRELTSQADIGFQVYTALAYGMKSINWFTYWEHWDTSANIVEGTAMVQSDGTKNGHYEWTKNVHSNIEMLEGALLNYDWLGTIELNLENYDDNNDSTNEGISTYTAADNDRLASLTYTGRAVVGCLQDKDGFDGYMIANAYEPHEGGSSTVSMTFNSADQAIVYGADGSVTTVDLTNGAYSVTLAAGTGVFVIPVYNG